MAGAAAFAAAGTEARAAASTDPLTTVRREISVMPASFPPPGAQTLALR
jgi:hypothetical protein